MGHDGSPDLIALAISALTLKFGGTLVMESHRMTYVSRLSINFIVTLIGLVLSAMAWPTLSKVLLAYGYLSRIPVAIVQYLAMSAIGARITMLWIPDFLSSASGQRFCGLPSSRTSFFMETHAVVVGTLVGIAAVLGRGQTSPAERSS